MLFINQICWVCLRNVIFEKRIFDAVFVDKGHELSKRLVVLFVFILSVFEIPHALCALSEQHAVGKAARVFSRFFCTL